MREATTSSATEDSGRLASSRSSSIAPGSSASSRTTPSPFHVRSPIGAAALSSVTGWSLSTAGVPSARTTGSTSDAMPLSTGPSGRNSHRSRMSAT
jgi:hypothetical protein